MEKHIGIAEARGHLSELIDRVASGKDRYIVERRGQPLAALVGAHEYRAMLGLLGDNGDNDSALDARGSADAETRFSSLKAAWRRDTQFASTAQEVAMHPAYQQIVGMGREAVPLLLHELSTEPDHWFWALKAITGEDPVANAHRGNLVEMTRAWLQWGRDHGYGS